MGGKKREGGRKREKGREFRERGSTFSLDFLAIGLSNSGETGGKVDPHCKSYAWVPVLWSFGKSRRKGFSPTCFIPWLRVIIMDRDILRPKRPCFLFQRLGLSGEIPRVVHDSPRSCVGLFIGLVYCCVIALKE